MLLFIDEALADHTDATCLSRDPTNDNANLEPCDASDPKQLFTYDTHPMSGKSGTPMEGLSGIRFWQDGNCLTEPAPGFSSDPTICDSSNSFFRVGIPTEDAFVTTNPITGDQNDFKMMYDEWGTCFFIDPSHTTTRFRRPCDLDAKWHVHYINEPSPPTASPSTPSTASPSTPQDDTESPKNEKKDDMTIYFIVIPVIIVILLVLGFLLR